jgi:SAM-dependent methyltransferase
LTVRPDDPCWEEWERTVISFYSENQRSGVGMRVNDAGYEIVGQVEIGGKTVLEVGPGDVRHHQYWRGLPAQYLLSDIDRSMLETAEKKLDKVGVEHRSILMSRGEPLPLDDCSVDVVLSFYSLEHIYPLQPYLNELRRVLRPGGMVVGAIPTEGGLAWGLGRLLTSRRWFLKNTSIDPDKIICWEHPNFADTIIRHLDDTFERVRVSSWPFPWAPLLDVNLVIRFVHTKSS